MNSPTEKFRISLSIPEMEYLILALSDKDPEITKPIIRMMQRHIISASVGLKKADIVVKNIPRSYEEKLGMTGLGKPTLTIDQKRESAYKKWCIGPQYCTQDELDLAFTHRANNGLLDPEEENKFWMEQMSKIKPKEPPLEPEPFPL